ncbi:molybdenum cofactor synthesis domain-containing protein [Marininema halotolerans]|uniref:Molybdopterin molybdenumtransferase n=1 Tax=Marininema halotolerans TaxID=1155944 RepID=A0A1I6TLD3_9BACL|nr:molybdenum cofactor synthesis domain-containing protein [Marininema halotolerans]SFS89940.1 molybdenum cofactor synthesis domain-containing protein [Marininema halotolerans]
MFQEFDQRVPISISEARERLCSVISFTIPKERIPVSRSLHRITAEGVFAQQATPSYPASAMDGIAVTSERTTHATKATPLVLKDEEFQWVNTGDPLPAGRDSVIMVEQLRPFEDGRIAIDAPAPPWKHVRQLGEDIAVSELILPSHHYIRPVDMGVLLAGGIDTVSVLAKPRVAIIPTGSEMIPPGVSTQPGQLTEFNSEMIRAFLEEWGAEGEILAIVPDDPRVLKRVIAESLHSFDILLIVGGSSAGKRDYTVDVLSEMGEILAHPVAARPGKPTVLSQVEGKPVIGLPGYPVSACLALEWFVPPLLHTWYGAVEKMRGDPTLTVRMDEKVVGKVVGEDFVRLGVMVHAGEFMAFSLGRGAGVTQSLSMADALLCLPNGCYEVEKGVEVEVKLLRSRKAIEQTIWISGEDDPLLDQWVAFFSERNPGWSLRKRLQREQSRSVLCHARIWRGTSSDPQTKITERIVPLAEQEWGWLIKESEVVPGCKGEAGLDFSKRKLLIPPNGSYLEKCLREREGSIHPIGWTSPSVWKAAACVASGIAHATVGTRETAERVGLRFIAEGTCFIGLAIHEQEAKSVWGNLLLASLHSPHMKGIIDSLAGTHFYDPNEVYL